MNQALYATIPMGLDGQYHVQRTLNGEVRYLAATFDRSRLAKLSFDLAVSTCKMLRYNAATVRDAVWIEPATAHLDTKKPMSMFPPARASSFCELGRA